jgi:FkbM family methyltransferase
LKPLLSALKWTALTAAYWKNAVQTFGFFLATKKDNLKREPFTWFQHKGLNFGVRPIDWFAMESIMLEHEYHLVQHLFAHQPPTLVIDAGANIGLFSIYILATWPNAQIFSIEASPETFSVLQKNQKQNPRYTWYLFQYALWDKDGEVFFDDEGLSLGWHVVTGASTLRVPALRLDSFIKKNICPDTRISLLKMDIEGAEQTVLQACPEVLDRVEALLIEIHPNLCDQAAVISILKAKFAYIYNVASPDSHFPLLLANRKPLPIASFQEKSLV